MKRHKIYPSQQDLNSRLSYDSSTGKLYWKYNPQRLNRWNTRYANNEAGTISKHDDLEYININLDKRNHIKHIH